MAAVFDSSPNGQFVREKIDRSTSITNAQKVSSIAIANILNHRTHQTVVVGDLAGFDITTKEIAEYSAKIFVTGKRHEAS